jgi:aminopeptidase N
MFKEAAGYFDESSDYQRPTATRKWRESFQLFDRHLYNRGACVLRFLHQKMGDEAWWRGIRHRFRDVETPDLIQALREATGMNLESAFEEWIYRAGHPDLVAHYRWEKGAVQLWIVQRDEKTLYTLPLGVRIDDDLYTVELKDREHLYTFSRTRAPKMVTLDPEYQIPVKKVEWVKPAAMWVHQLMNDPNPIGRIDASVAVGARGTEKAVLALDSAFRKEKFWGVQAEIARALGKIGTDVALQALLRLTSTRHPKARRAVVEALGEFRDGRTLLKLSSMLSDPSIHVRAEAVRSAARSGHHGASKLILRAWKMKSWNDTIRAACVDGTATLSGELESILPYTKSNQPLQVRLAAIRQIPRVAKGRPEAAQLLLELSKDPSEFVSYVALAVISRLSDGSIVPELQKLTQDHIGSRIRSTADRAVRVIRMGMSGSFPKPVPGKVKV